MSLTLDQLWIEAVLNYWNKFGDAYPSGVYDTSIDQVQFAESDGYVNTYTGRVFIHPFVVSDPQGWSQEERYLINRIPNGTKVLELGCGTGRFGVYLQNTKKCSYTGIDTSQDMVNICKARGLTAYVMDAQHMTFPSNSFDVIIVMNTFFAEFLSSSSAVPTYLQTILNLLTTNGIIVGSSYYYTPNYPDYSYIVAHGEQHTAIAQWHGITCAQYTTFRIQNASAFLASLQNIGLNILDSIYVSLFNDWMVKFGYIVGLTTNWPGSGHTCYVDWVPVRITVPYAPALIVGDGMSNVIIPG